MQGVLNSTSECTACLDTASLLEDDWSKLVETLRPIQEVTPR